MTSQLTPEDDGRIVLAVAWLAHVDIRDRLGGGVPSSTLTKILPWKQKTIARHCRELCDAGVLVEVQGVALRHGGDHVGRRARPSFLPVGHPDAPGDETHRTPAEVRRADD